MEIIKKAPEGAFLVDSILRFYMLFLNRRTAYEMDKLDFLQTEILDWKIFEKNISTWS